MLCCVERLPKIHGFPAVERAVSWHTGREGPFPPSAVWNVPAPANMVLEEKLTAS
jgi:hypothetical protein